MEYDIEGDTIMADLEQIPGTLNLKFPAGDDLVVQYNIPFNASSYTWVQTLHKGNQGNITIPISSSVQTSVLTIVLSTFYSSTTSAFVTSTDRIQHSHRLKATDPNGIVRTYVEGTVTIT